MRTGMFVISLAVLGAALSGACLGQDNAVVPPEQLWERLRVCIGKGHLTKKLHKARTELGEEFTATYSHAGVDGRIETGFWHMWHSRGLDMRFDEESRLDYFILYLEPPATHKPYSFPLPAKLERGDGPAQVLHKLGEPAEKTDLQWLYPDRGLSVTFDVKPSEGAKPKVSHVGANAVKPKK